MIARLLTLAICAVLPTAPAAAHDGPPYPIFVDETVERWTVSVWTDPDVGTGTFYYYVTPPAGRSASELSIQALAAPADGGSPAVSGFAEHAEPDEPFQQLGTLEFAYRGAWRARFVLRAGGHEGEVLGELAYDLDVTPPGLGAFDLLLYAFPFLVIGGFWVRALLAQRAYVRQASAAARS